MDCDSEVISKLIYPHGIPDKWKDDNEFYSYINKLGTYDVEQLNKGPDHIIAELTAIQNQTQELAFNNYKTFIQAADCSHTVFTQFNKSEESLDSLIKKFPDMSVKCDEFLKKAKEIKGWRRVNTLCLTKHSSVLQILEVVQLLETVIKDGMYEEALQLAAFVRRMAKTHQNVPILQEIVADIEKIWWILLCRLVGQLRSDLPLPKCLQVMGHLRRMDVLTPLELKLKFLQARDHWFQSQISAIPNDDPATHLSKVIELSRTHLFNIITQYKAVFAEEDSVIISSVQNFDDIPILQAWINNKVCEFVSRLEADLELGVGSAVPSLMSQCMYFGQSLGRVGADIRPCLTKPFLRAIINNFEVEMEKARTHFQSDMDKFQLSSSDSILYKMPTEPSFDMGISKQLATPTGLLEFYPLSLCCNNMLSGLNELRLCAPLALAHVITTSLQTTLMFISDQILQFYSREQQALTSEEKIKYSKLCACFAQQLVPYIQRCLHAIYSPSEISTCLNVSVHQIQSEGLTFLDVPNIVKPIEHLLPIKPISIPLKQDLPPSDLTQEDNLNASESPALTSEPESPS